MIEFRNDIFVNMNAFFNRRETIATWINEAHQALASLFPLKEEFIAYINSLNKPEDAELLIRVSQFYGLSKIYEEGAHVKLIMIISAIEKIASKGKKYEEFFEWIAKQGPKIDELLPKEDIIDTKKFMGIMVALKEEYYKEYGSRRNVLSFFKEYLTLDDKMKLIKSIRRNLTDTVERYGNFMKSIIYKEKVASIQELNEKYGLKSEKSLMPNCYDWETCYVEHGECYPTYGCAVLEDSGSLDKALKKVVDDIYQMRSDFVHNATLPSLGKADIITFGVINGELAVVELTSEDLEDMFERALKKYFDELRIK